ncbi:unnamed protein product [Rotaria magnacalcarata]|uniref:Uncharacterized protein n=2 Tax=Rotaria magnacalcarata TaxID=392030 RepID=A0A8S2KR13_9BILA|nr:unnamed protein product [Rotaria magnacalcarata]
MELNEDDGHWRVTVDTPDDEIYSFHLNLCFHFSSGIYHYQFKVVTESWFEQELEPALPEKKYDEDKTNVTAKVDYLVKLDVIAVEIMPINEFPGHIGWGYTPRYHFAIQSTYGTTADMKEILDTFNWNRI